MPAALDRGLVAGFAEEQAKLFEDAPSAIRTLDQVAADANAGGYRDLLHEIDRAFAGYDRDAVRHGWFAGQGLHADAAAPCGRRRRMPARRAGTRLHRSARISSPPASRRKPECGRAGAAGICRRTGRDGLDAVPGFDAASRHDPRRAFAPMTLRSPDGAPLAFLGRAHPLVRRAITRAQRGATR